MSLCFQGLAQETQIGPACSRVKTPLDGGAGAQQDGAMGIRDRIAEDQVVELAEMFRLMSDPTRLRIILASLDAPVPVGEMAETLQISASLVSHHLRLLRAARLLQAERRGRQVFYMVGDAHIRSMLTDMVDHVAEVDAEAENAPSP
jgi:DNA-binding transcriptional ArsR family regulator